MIGLQSLTKVVIDDCCNALKMYDFSLKSSLCLLVIKNSHRVTQARSVSNMRINRSVSVPRWHTLRFFASLRMTL